MTDDADTSLSEKRVHAARGETARAVVACGLGLATVDVSDDQIGRFGLAHRVDARDVAGNGRLAVATGTDVLVGDTDVLEETGFGPAVAVGVRTGAGHGGDLLAAGPDGRVARLVDRGTGDESTVVGEWVDVGTLGNALRAIDGDLVAADGVYRAGDSLTDLGMADVRDVAAAGPYAATPAGVVRLEDDWIEAVDGDATLVASDGSRTHAVVDGRLLARRAGEWVDAGCPVDDVVAVAYGPATYAVTADGTFLVDATASKDGTSGWRSRELGLRDVVGLAVL